MVDDPVTNFCIMKHVSSMMSPWLCTYNGELCYAALEQIVGTSAALKEFKTEDAAQQFIERHPEICSPQNLVCKVQYDSSGMKVEIIKSPGASHTSTT